MNELKRTQLQTQLNMYADDILKSSGMNKTKNYAHHGTVSCYEHSVAVALMSLSIAKFFHVRVDVESLLRGALLHDYYLYDWHERGSHTGLHGFNHAKIALQNAERDFSLNEIQRDIIEKHMFPMNPALPRCKETVIVTIADKICSTKEIISERFKRSM